MSGAMQLLLATKAPTGFDELAWSVSGTAGAGSITATVTLNTDGTTSVTASSGDTINTNSTTNWHSPTTTNIGFSYWITVTDVGIDAITGTVTLANVSSTITLDALCGTGNSTSHEALIEVFSDSGGTNKVTEITLTITLTA
jgi:hypothetical protein